MEKKAAAFQNKGMIRDTSISKASNELAFENFNIRVTARDHDTLLSVTNERGNLPIDIRNEKTGEGEPELLSIDGILIGYSVLNSYLVLFTTEEANDHIYRICYHALEDPEWTGRELYSGDLNFNVENPIEALSNYESEGVQKVYWVDGLNLPRFINIADSQLDSTVNRNGLFDFIIKVDKYPVLSVTKQFVGSSTIPSGVIQYVCTYSNEGGQETNITYRSPLYYSSLYDRGAAADTVPNNSFSIEISNMSTLFDYINIYRVMRTSENGTATAARIAKLKTSELSITYVDNGTSLAEIDPTALLYIGGRSIIPNTLSQKDNTLFLGNYTVDTAVSDPEIEEAVSSGRNDEGYNNNLEFSLSTPEMGIPYVEGSGYYPYNCLLNYSEDQIKTFKGGEKYRIGIRFMKDTGELSPVYWIGDQENTHYPVVNVPSERIAKAYLTYKIPEGLIDTLHDKGYTHAELLMAEASNSDRKILAQGIVCPTLFNLRQRYSNSPFAVSSWYFRPINGNLSNLHFSSLGTSDTVQGELQCSKPLSTGTDDEGSNAPTPYATTDYFGTNYLSMRYRIEVYNDKTWPGIIWQRNIKWILEYSASPVEEAESATDWTYIDSDNNIGTNWGRIFRTFVRPALRKWGFDDSNIPSEDTFVGWVEADTGKGGWRQIGPCGGPQTIGTLRGSMGYDYSNVFSPYYFVDESICTFHSPECANGRSSSFDNLNCGFRIVGIAPLSSTMSDYDLTVEGNRMNSSGGLGILNLNQPIGSEDLNGLITLPLWQDAIDPENLNVMRTFWIYPWHKTGSIINNGDYDKLESKHEANLRFSLYTNYLFADKPWTPPNGIGAVRASNSDEAQLLSIDTQWGTKTYQATGDWVLSMSSVYPANADLSDPNVTVDPQRDQGYFVYMTGTNVSASSSVETMKQQGEFIPFPEDGATNPNKRANRCYDPVNISYKSTEHLVFSFKATEETPEDIVTLPYIKYTDGGTITEYHMIPDVVNKDKTYLPWVEQASELQTAISISVFPYDENTRYFTQESYTGSQLSLQVPYNWFDESGSKFNSASWILAMNTTGVETLYDKSGKTFTPVKTTLPSPWNIVISAVGYNEETGEVSTTIRFSTSAHASSTRVSWTGAGSGSNSQATSPVTLTLGTIPFTEAGVNTFNIGMQAISSNSSYWDNSANQSIGTVTLTITSTETEEGEPVLSWSTSSEVTYHPSTPQETDNIIITGTANPASETETYAFEVNDVTYLYEDGNMRELGIQEFDYYRGNPVNVSSEDFDIDIPFFYVAELYNTFEDSEGKVHDTRYGGVSDAAVQANTFIPISSPIKLWEDNEDGSRTDITEISSYSGDTYVSRYDILKTLPYSDSSENSITEIASVLLETHINVDGRTDTNRGNSSMLGITEENFNIYNDVYSSDNNFFSGAVLSSSRFSTNIFPSQITWTLTKTPNEEIDTWTNITLASVLDMDGDKGPVRAIRRYQNSLIAFQDKGIAEILFNSRTQLATTEGVPIEIANSGRVDGKRYVTDKAGCVNKWSIVETSRGIYFIDNINSSISVFNGSVQSLSDAKGFKDWIGRNNSTDLWNPRDFNNFVSFWDRVNDDVYFLRGNEGENHDVLCYNEQLQQFVSFYNYGKVPMMVNVQDKFVAFKTVNTGDETTPDYKYLWKQGEGLYSHIFNEYQNFYTLYRVTPEPYSDKTFTNLTYRADMFDMNQDNDFMPGEGLLTGNTFDTLEVWNEYQGNKVNLEFTVKDLYPDKRRKFRIWRMDIPRDRKSGDNPYGLNRIRNPWIYLKLEKDNTNLEEGHNERMEFHDLAVSYFE